MTINELINELKELASKYGEDTACTGEVIVKPRFNTITLEDGTKIICPAPNKHIVMH